MYIFSAIRQKAAYIMHSDFLQVRVLNKITGILLLAVFGGFFLLDTSLHRVLFYGLLVTLLVFLFQTNIREFFQNKQTGCVLLGLYLIYSLLSILWSSNTDFIIFMQTFKVSVFIAVFTCGAAIFFADYPNFKVDFYRVYVYVSFLTACILLIKYAPDIYRLVVENDYFRLEGLGRGVNSNLCSAIFGTSVIIMLFGPKELFREGPLENLYIRGLFLLFCLCVVIFTFSRGPFLALLSATLFLTLVSQRYYVFAVFIASILCIGLFFVEPEMITKLVERADTHRFDLWEQSISLIQQKPVLGYGVGHEFKLVAYEKNEVFVSPHNVYLGMILYGGFVGAVLFLSMGLFFLKKAWFIAHERGDNIPLGLFIYGSVFFLFSGHTIYLNLNVEWLFSFIPAAIILGEPLSRERS